MTLLSLPPEQEQPAGKISFLTALSVRVCIPFNDWREFLSLTLSYSVLHTPSPVPPAASLPIPDRPDRTALPISRAHKHTHTYIHKSTHTNTHQTSEHVQTRPADVVLVAIVSTHCRLLSQLGHNHIFTATPTTSIDQGRGRCRHWSGDLLVNVRGNYFKQKFRQ